MRETVSEFSRTGLKDQAVWDQFASTLYYVQGDYDRSEGYQRLKEFITGFDHGSRVLPVRVFYLATPPDLYGTVIQNIAAVGLVSKETDEQTRDPGRHREALRHRFTDRQELNRKVHEVLDENQIYRIDHYLGKETVQNIMVFRFANAVFEPIWNRRYVDHVQILRRRRWAWRTGAAITKKSGVVRDMFQNHLLQLLCLTAMEPPVGFSADAARDEKGKLLKSVRPMAPDEVASAAVRGQYGPGRIDGKEVVGYREEPDVAKDSPTPTYAAIKFFVDNWRWEGVPFYLRSGKRLAKRVTEIAIQFKRPPLLLFRSCAVDDVSPNVLVMQDSTRRRRVIDVRSQTAGAGYLCQSSQPGF